MFSASPIPLSYLSHMLNKATCYRFMRARASIWSWRLSMYPTRQTYALRYTSNVLHRRTWFLYLWGRACNVCWILLMWCRATVGSGEQDLADKKVAKVEVLWFAKSGSGIRWARWREVSARLNQLQQSLPYFGMNFGIKVAKWLVKWYLRIFVFSDMRYWLAIG